MGNLLLRKLNSLSFKNNKIGDIFSITSKIFFYELSKNLNFKPKFPDFQLTSSQTQKNNKSGLAAVVVLEGCWSTKFY